MLTELNLSDNRLTRLSPDIAELASLVRLDLSNNRLKALPTDIGLLKKLEHLCGKQHENQTQ